MSKYDYDIIVIGGGAAGLTASGICASFGARTALVEKHKLGGDCTWYGCVPSKALLHVAKQVAAIERGDAVGIRCKGLSIDFSAVMASVRQVRKVIYEEADAPPLMRDRGVNVIEGVTRFSDKHSVKITGADGGSQIVTFRSAIVAAGASPLKLPIPGLAAAGFLTNETLFELREQPPRLVILGNGPIGVEMAQSFSLLGTQVTVIGLDPQILIRDEPQCSDLIERRLKQQRVIFRSGETIHRVRKRGSSYQLEVGPRAGSENEISCDALLVAVGRKPNLKGLELKNAGILSHDRGIPVDRYCRTNVKHIFACGDITTFLKFTHVAENMAKAAAVNAVLRLPLLKYQSEVIPWVTYTDPESAHVGKTGQELQSDGIKFETIEFPYSKIDRAVTERSEEGIIILHTRGGKILGAHAAGTQAGELISEYALAMKNGLKLAQISDTVHAYPTMLLGARRAADQFYIRLHRKWMSRLVQIFYRYQGDIPKYVGEKTVM